MIRVSPDALESLIVSQLTKFKNEEKPWSADVYEFSDSKVEQIAKSVRTILESVDVDRGKMEVENDTQTFFNKEFETEAQESRKRQMVMMKRDKFLNRSMEQAHEVSDEEE
tara:strand:- start:1457 stop:1789 length:333 start_codon:yes stop_codon:yes gene_type:complete